MRIKLSPGAKAPTYATDSSVGLDLYAAMSTMLWPGERRLIDTGVSIELPGGTEGQIRPRSGMAAMAGVFALLGTIDQDYRGPLMVNLLNTGRDVFKVDVGDRIAQLVVAPVTRVSIEVVEELSETARGVSGFGSSGK